MKFSYLKEFLILAQMLSFSAAAERMYLAQPVLSRHISALEDALGAKLFHRTHQGVTLTEAGRLYYEHVRPMVAEYDALCAKIHLLEQGYDASLRIGLPYYSMNSYLGRAPMRFMEAYPKISLSYLTDHPDKVIHALHTDAVDLLVIAHMPFQYAETFLFHDLFDERLSVLFARSHPLAGRETVKLAELRDEVFLGVESNFFSCTWELLSTLCRARGFLPRPPLLLNQFESVLIAAQQGRGIVLEGKNLYNLPTSDLVAVPLAEEDCFRRVSVVYKAENSNPAISKMVRVFDREYT